MMTQQSDASDEQVKQLISILDFFKKHSAYGIDSSLIEKLLLLMLQGSFHLFPCFPLKASTPLQPIYRMTINKKVVGKNKRIRNIKQLKYPPPENVLSYGRCNLKHQSVFYGTFDRLTMFNEVQPNDGDLVSVSTWETKPGAGLVLCPIFKNQPRDGTHNPRTWQINDWFEQYLESYPINIRKGTNELFQFMTDEFSKEVTSDDRNYIFSAVYSSKIFNEFENGVIDAIRYPSVKQKLSFENIAIKAPVFDSKYQIAEVYDGIVNGRFINTFNHCKRFDIINNEILWDPEVAIPKEKLDYYYKTTDLDLT